MKKIFIGVSIVLLAGCQQVKNEESPMEFMSEEVDTAGLDEICGGYDGLSCASGLECQFDGTLSQGQGRCIRSTGEEAGECPEVKSPVCAQKGRTKNAYLNGCEALRHEAEFVHAGFCQPDETVKESCEGEVKAIGNCDTVFIGYEMWQGRCREFSVTACAAEIPFDTLEACQSACE